ncbi:MAG: DUF362 domain-containing protein [Fibrobacterota bacterium]
MKDEKKYPDAVVTACGSYSPSETELSLRKALSLLGGPERFFVPGSKVFLKPNLLSPSPPEKAVTTHPSVFGALCSILKESGVNIYYGDSPAISNLKKASEVSGLAREAEKYGVFRSDFKTCEKIISPETGIVYNTVKCIKDYDFIISLPKFKTHELMKITCCVKNQLGLVAGLSKAGMHVRFPGPESFAEMLIDLNRIVSPSLYIVDAVVSMEGNGPNNGTPFKTGAIIAGTNPFACNAAACRLINLDPEFVPVMKKAREAGIDKGNYRISYSGMREDESFPSFRISRTKTGMPGLSSLINFLPGAAGRAVRNRIINRPVISDKKCKRCGICTDICPVEPKALRKGKNSSPPVFDYSKCIRCYCCQETCPHNAIKSERPSLGKILSLVSRIKNRILPAGN